MAIAVFAVLITATAGAVYMIAFDYLEQLFEAIGVADSSDQERIVSGHGDGPDEPTVEAPIVRLIQQVPMFGWGIVIGMVVLGFVYRVYQIREDTVNDQWETIRDGFGRRADEDYILDWWERLPGNFGSYVRQLQDWFAIAKETFDRWMRELWEGV